LAFETVGTAKGSQSVAEPRRGDSRRRAPGGRRRRGRRLSPYPPRMRLPRPLRSWLAPLLESRRGRDVTPERRLDGQRQERGPSSSTSSAGRRALPRRRAPRRPRPAGLPRGRPLGVPGHSDRMVYEPAGRHPPPGVVLGHAAAVHVPGPLAAAHRGRRDVRRGGPMPDGPAQPRVAQRQAVDEGVARRRDRAVPVPAGQRAARLPHLRLPRRLRRLRAAARAQRPARHRLEVPRQGSACWAQERGCSTEIETGLPAGCWSSWCDSEVVRLRRHGPGRSAGLEALEARSSSASTAAAIRSRELKRALFLLASMGRPTLSAATSPARKSRSPSSRARGGRCIGLVTPFILSRACRASEGWPRNKNREPVQPSNFGDRDVFEAILANTHLAGVVISASPPPTRSWAPARSIAPDLRRAQRPLHPHPRGAGRVRARSRPKARRSIDPHSAGTVRTTQRAGRGTRCGRATSM